jgi:hypothetical protein
MTPTLTLTPNRLRLTVQNQKKQYNKPIDLRTFFLLRTVAGRPAEKKLTGLAGGRGGCAPHYKTPRLQRLQ